MEALLDMRSSYSDRVSPGMLGERELHNSTVEL